MGAPLNEAAGVAGLTKTWEQILANDAADDLLSAGVERFAQRADEFINELADQLHTGGYTPRPLTELVIPKDDGSERLLRIPVVRDRVVERAVLAVLRPRIDPWFGAASFAFRPGLGVADAVRALARLRDVGYS